MFFSLIQDSIPMAVLPPPALKLWGNPMPDYGPRAFEWQLVSSGSHLEIRISYEFAHRHLDGKLSRIISLREELKGSDPEKLSEVTDSIIAILGVTRGSLGVPAGGSLRADQIVLTRD
jgi:hypothetical protein